MTLVSGQVAFHGDLPNATTALLTVKLEDVSLAGMASTVVAKHQQDIDLRQTNAVTFDLSPNADSPEINPQSRYTVTAHVSLHPNDEPEDIRQGDFLTMQSYPVLTQGNPSVVTVEVKRLG